MLSEFQTQKFTYLFRVMDAGRDERIDLADLDLMVERLGETGSGNGMKPDRLKKVSEKYRDMYHGMLQLADSNNDGTVTLKEFLAYVDRVVNDKAMYDGMVGALTDLFGDILDGDGDGMNELDDYRGLLRVLSLDETQAAATFKELDGDGDGRISRGELQRLVREFYGDDRTAPGNCFFGNFQKS